MIMPRIAARKNNPKTRSSANTHEHEHKNPSLSTEVGNPLRQYFDTVFFSRNTPSSFACMKQTSFILWGEPQWVQRALQGKIVWKETSERWGLQIGVQQPTNVGKDEKRINMGVMARWARQCRELCSIQTNLSYESDSWQSGRVFSYRIDMQFVHNHYVHLVHIMIVKSSEQHCEK